MEDGLTSGESLERFEYIFLIKSSLLSLLLLTKGSPKAIFYLDAMLRYAANHTILQDISRCFFKAFLLARYPFPPPCLGIALMYCQKINPSSARSES